MTVWVFNTRFLSDPKMPGTAASGGEDAIQLWDEIDDFRFNPRAIAQGSVFMKVHWDALPLEKYLGPYLTKFTIPASERSHVLGKLNEMRINHRQLFHDLDYAARTAKWLIIEAE